MRQGAPAVIAANASLFQVDMNIYRVIGRKVGRMLLLFCIAGIKVFIPVPDGAETYWLHAFYTQAIAFCIC